MVLPMPVAAEHVKPVLIKFLFLDPLEELPALVTETAMVRVIVDFVCIIRTNQWRR